MRHEADAGQCFTSEPQCGDGLEVFKRTQLAGGVPAQAEEEVREHGKFCTVV